jgi:hypothetical protein
MVVCDKCLGAYLMEVLNLNAHAIGHFVDLFNLGA